MKKIFFIATGLSSILFAEEATERALDHRFFIGPDIFWDHTDFNPPEKEGIKFKYKSNSPMFGIRVGYDYLKSNCIYYGAYIMSSAGHQSSREEGKTPFTLPERKKESGYRTFSNAEGRIGYNFKSPLFARTTVTPFIGGGGFFNKRKGNHNFNWGYATLGVRLNFGFTEDLDIGANLKVMNAFNDVWGFEGALPLTWKICHRWDFQLEPYYLRPDAKWPTQILGSRFLFGYRF
ncbi:MAG: hypothetical protein JSR58_00920 [Verrucomicrobia bacterium]|nr:hypothetical protein [Verrucomicrobiota bacterium]